jgi:spore coat polysaccharide biosynthesis predicted glycosyltransferase SpsG
MNLTLKVVNALDKVNVKDLDVKIVAGASNNHLESLEIAASKITSSIEIIQYVNDMPELMAWADFAVLAGGSTNLELLFMGLPYTAMITAENQRLNVEKLSLLNATINLGWYENLETGNVAEVLNRLLPSKCLREKMSANCRNLVDGMGAERVVSALMSYTNN